jgi:hypothetical protein
MINKKIAAEFGLPEITIVTDYSISPELIEKCYQVEISHFPDSADTHDIFVNKMRALPDFCFVLVHEATQKVVGYFTILPISDDAVMRIFKNELLYDTLTPGDICDFSPNGLYNLYFDTKMVSKQYQTPETAQLVFMLVANTIIEKARHFCLCNYLVLDQFREFSKILADSMKMNLLRTIKYNSGAEANLFGMPFNPSAFFALPNGSALEFAYNNDAAKAVLIKRRDLWQDFHGAAAK